MSSTSEHCGEGVWPREMSATSGYQSTTDSDPGHSKSCTAPQLQARRTRSEETTTTNNDAVMPASIISTTSQETSQDSTSIMYCGGTQASSSTSRINSLEGSTGDDLQGFSSDSDYAGQSDCESSNFDASDLAVDEEKSATGRKRKVASRRAACGSQNDELSDNRMKSLSVDSDCNDEDAADDYVDIHPVDLSTRLAEFRLSSNANTHALTERYSYVPFSSQVADQQQQKRKADDDDYEEMAPHDPYAIAGRRPTYSRNNSTGCYVTAHPIPQKLGKKQISDQSVLSSSGVVSMCSTDSGEGNANVRSRDASPVALQKSPNKLYDKLSGYNACSAYEYASGRDQLDGGDVDATDADHDYTNVEERQDMPLPDVWLARKQILHDYEDPDYAVAGESSDDDEEDDGGVEEPAYAAGVQLAADRPSGYQSRAGFNHMEVNSEPETTRFAISPPIAHKLKRKNSEGALYKLPAFPAHPASQVNQRRSSQSSMTLGLTSRPVSRVEASSGSLTPGTLRPTDISLTPTGASGKTMKSGRSTPTLRDRFTSFSLNRFNSPMRNRPPSSLSASQLALSSLGASTPGGLSLQQQQMSVPRSRHSMYIGDASAAAAAAATATLPVADSAEHSPALQRHAEYDSIASKWTTIDRSSPKSKQKRSPFSLLTKKTDKRKKASR